MYFQTTVNLICTFSYGNHVYIFRSIFAVYHLTYVFVCTFAMYVCLLLLFRSYLRVTLYLPVKSVELLCISLPAPVPLSTCLSLFN